MTLPNTPVRRSPPRLLHVLRTQQITPAIRRVTLGGETLVGFPLGRQGAHIKLLLPRDGQMEPVLPTLGPQGPIWPPKPIRPITRTYSVRHYRPESQELDIDFVLHADDGPASRWAKQAHPGDYVGVAGPSDQFLKLNGIDWYLFVGDLTALPAMSALLELLPPTAQGQALIEIPDMSERQTLSFSAQIELSWLPQNGLLSGQNSLLEDAVKRLTWPDGQGFAWLAGEAKAVVAIRAMLRQERGLTREFMYTVPYWKAGLSEESYHDERHQVMDEE